MIKYIFVILCGTFFCLSAYAKPAVSVEAYDEQRNNPSYLALRIRITNNTQDTLRNVKLQYSLPFDSTRILRINESYLGDSCRKAMLSLDTVNNKIVLNIAFSTVGLDTYPNQGGLSVGLYYADGENFNKKSSSCYPTVSYFANTVRIPVYVNDRLTLGIVDAQPMALIDGSKVFLYPHQKVPFAWHPVFGAEQYKLAIYNNVDTSLVYEELTDKVSSKVNLKQGNYLWNVDAVSYGFSYEEWEIVYTGMNYVLNSVSVEEADENLVYPIADLHVSPLAARKDTPMLDLKWGELLDSMEWDKPHNTSAYIDPMDGQLKFSDPKHQNRDDSEDWRCWAVATIMMNHYYGGNATQDELVFYEKASAKKDSALHAFMRGAENGGQFNPDWAFGVREFENFSHHYPSASFVDALKHDAPIAICEMNHCMVIDACSYYDHGAKRDTLCRFINTDNEGSSLWMNLTNHLRSVDAGYFLKQGVLPKPRMVDSLILNPTTGTWRDSDGDGILDFDEVYRFHTDPHKKDSDGDGIEDKVEIWSYTRLEPYDFKAGVTTENFADIEGDGIRAELDSDSDNDGLEDGMEDSNHNGYVDEGESNPYFDEKKYREMNVPEYFGMYALSQLAINDGARCYEGMDTLFANYCNVAAAGSSNENHTVNIGVKAVVGNVFSRGDFFLRSFSVIDTLYLTSLVNDIEMNKSTNAILKIHVQDGFVRKRKDVVDEKKWKSNWPIVLPIDTFEVSSTSIVVKAGDTLILNNLISYKMIRVQSMGVLVVNPGEYWVGELQLHSGSRLIFSQSEKPSILHINGNVHWHPTLINRDYSMLAKRFKMVHHGPVNMFIESLFAGTIVAPESNVMLGQSTKVFYGSVLAKNITLHQHSNFYHIPYKPD